MHRGIAPPGAGAVKLPDLEELLVLRGAARPLALRARGSAHALLLGSHRSSHHGRGLEFEEVRAYAAGDDPRSIDWRVTARRGRVHTKLFREERERPVWLLVDLDNAMYFGSRSQLKSMAAVRAAALLAWIAASTGDRVGAVVVGPREIRVLPPRSREAGVLPVLNLLVDQQPRAPGRSTADSLHRAVMTLAPLVHPGSLVLVLSDFARGAPTDGGYWSGIAQHSDCRWIWIRDPLEAQSLPDGHYRAGVPDPIVPIDGASIRASWLAAWREREASIKSSAQAMRIELVELDTAEEVSGAISSWLQSSKTAA
jgi:uncharacterized protein (DUF58 family)